MQDELKPFLEPTEYCDFNHPEIQKIAKEFKEKYPGQKELAVKLFYFVRDSILYRVGLWQKKASETLAEGKGTCTNKANLFISLLRACGIPAGYNVMKVKGREYFGPVALNTFSNRISEKSVHIYSSVFLNGKWIKCDCSDDKEFSRNTSYFNPQSNLVDWDGENNAESNIDPDHVFGEEGPLANIDGKIAKKPKNAKGAILKLGNLYVDFLRQNEIRIKEVDEIIPLFKNWLRKNYFFYFCYFCLALKLSKKTNARSF